MTGSLLANEDVRRWVARSLAIDAHTAHVVTALREAGVPSVLLKGPSIARWLYTDGTPRPYGDTDLLVPADRMPEVERVLESVGLVRLIRPVMDHGPRVHASDWARPDGSGKVDLHWTIAEVEAAELVWPVVWREAETMEIAGCDVHVCSEPMRALNVALHALHHGRDGGKPVKDLARALSVVHHDTWARAADLARELDAVAALTLGLALLPEGVVVARTLGVDADGATRELVLTAEGASGEARTLASVLGEPTWARRARSAFFRLVPPPTFVRAWDAQRRGPRRGTLLGAYARRLVAVASTAPEAIRANWRLRKGPDRP